MGAVWSQECIHPGSSGVTTSRIQWSRDGHPLRWADTWDIANPYHSVWEWPFISISRQCASVSNMRKSCASVLQGVSCASTSMLLGTVHVAFFDVPCICLYTDNVWFSYRSCGDVVPFKLICFSYFSFNNHDFDHHMARLVNYCFSGDKTKSWNYNPPNSKLLTNC